MCASGYCLTGCLGPEEEKVEKNLTRVGLILAKNLCLKGLEVTKRPHTDKSFTLCIKLSNFCTM